MVTRSKTIKKDMGSHISLEYFHDGTPSRCKGEIIRRGLQVSRTVKYGGRKKPSGRSECRGETKSTPRFVQGETPSD